MRKDSPSTPQKFVCILIAACFMLQSVVPVGYMPASLSQEGSLVKFCPSGVSDAVMAILHKDHAMHAQHRHSVSEAVPAEQAAHHHSHHHHGPHHNVQQVSVTQLNYEAAQIVSQVESKAHSYHVGEHHPVWQSDCEFGASAGTDLFAASLAESSQLNLAFYRTLLHAFDLHASLARSKKQSRAPPISIS